MTLDFLSLSVPLAQQVGVRSAPPDDTRLFRIEKFGIFATTISSRHLGACQWLQPLVALFFRCLCKKLYPGVGAVTSSLRTVTSRWRTRTHHAYTYVARNCTDRRLGPSILCSIPARFCTKKNRSTILQNITVPHRKSKVLVGYKFTHSTKTNLGSAISSAWNA